MVKTQPTIYYELGLGSFLNECIVNTNAVASYMKGRGFTDKQIAAVTIGVSIHDPDAEENPETFVTAGQVWKTKMLIKIYPKMVLRIIVGGRLSDNKDTRVLFNSETEINLYASERFSGTLAHEIEHLKIELEGGMPKSAKDVVIIPNDISEEDEEYQAYLKEPEEIRCRKAAEDAPKNLISLAYKVLPEMI